MIRQFSNLLLFILFLAGPGIAKAQLPGQNPNQDPDLNPIGSSVIRDTTPSDVLPLDTPVAMTYVVINDPDELHTFADTFLWDDNDHFPLNFHESHLGNYGSPSRSLAPSIDLRSGFYTGWDQYDPYYIFADSFRYYNQHVPVAKIKYSQANQKDTYLTLDFGRTFAKGVSLSFTYDRINQIGRYLHQHQKNTALGIGIWHNAPSGKYDAFYNYIADDAVSEENGGLSEPEMIFDTNTFTDLSLNVFIKDGITTHKYKFFTTKHILHLISDTTDIGIDLWVQGNIGSGIYKYVDEEVSADTVTANYYGSFLVDERGIRQFTSLNEYEFAGGISLPWRAARSILQSSLSYRSVNLQQEPLETRINELFWNASGKFRWIEPLELRGLMSLGLGQAAGSFLFKADGSLNTKILGKLEGHWSVVTRNPYMIEDRLYVNQQLMYDNDFQNPFTTEFGVAWNWERQSLKAGIQWIIYDNYIFYNALRVPEQIDESFSLRRFNVSKDFDFKWVGLKGNFIWQPDAREELAIPELMYKASAYGRVKIFKRKVTLMPGLDFTYHDGFRGVSYFPVTGRYHLSDGAEIPDYFRVDAALGVHINFLKAFVRMDDLIALTGLWQEEVNQRVLYQADFYPHYRGYFRIGIEAGFFN